MHQKPKKKVSTRQSIPLHRVLVGPVHLLFCILVVWFSFLPPLLHFLVTQEDSLTFVVHGSFSARNVGGMNSLCAGMSKQTVALKRAQSPTVYATGTFFDEAATDAHIKTCQRNITLYVTRETKTVKRILKRLQEYRTEKNWHELS